MQKLSCIIMFLAMALDVAAQSILGSQDAIEDLFHQSVKSCDEFMCRFNEEEFFPNLDRMDSQRGQKNFLLLFNYELTKGKDKEAFIQNVLQFYDVVKANNVKLKYESKNWYAEQRLTFIYKKKAIDINIVLQSENTPKNLPCWTIVGINGLEKIGYVDSLSRMVISPEQHEADFMELESDFKFYSKKFSQFRSYKKQIDALSYFFALVESGTLVFDKRVSTIFHFFDVPSYVFSVSFFNRNTSNSGWLISNYQKVKQEDKEIILNKLLSR